MKKKSIFIVLDGIDGSGTTTHSQLLTGFLKSKKYNVFLTHEPSNSEIGLLIRKFLKDKEIPPAVDALMFAADRVLHFNNEIKRKLNEGYIVISDRYIESSIVYQSCESDEISLEWVKTINTFAQKPDLTIILDIDPKTSLARKSQDSLDKFEDSTFLVKVRNLYLARAEEERYQIVNTDDIIELVQEKIQQIVLKKLNQLII
ncbi:MAG: dTMP kinase [Candidatus Thorarchaeota archaeon]